MNETYSRNEDQRARIRVRALGLLSVDFLLDQATIGVGELTATDTLLVLAINQANIAPLTREAAARSAYGGLGAPAPDTERRPVSISAIAHSLGLPFETTRRHVKALEASGVCISTGRGVIVPQAFLQSDSYIATVVAGHGRLRAFYAEARAANLLDPLPPSAFPTDEAEPVRAAARLRADYALRSAEHLTAMMGDVISAVIFLAVVSARGQPVTVASLSRRLGIPEETVRRRAAGLVERGACERTGKGLNVTDAILDDGPAGAFFDSNVANAQRLFAALAERGVIASWGD